MDVRTALTDARIDPSSLRPVGGLECDVWQVSLPGAEAQGGWRRLRTLAGRTGRWPVIVGDYFGPDAVLDYIRESLELRRTIDDQTRAFRRMARDRDEVLRLAVETPFDRWVTQKHDPDYLAREWLREANFLEGRPGAESYVALCRRLAEEWRQRPHVEFDPAAVPWPESTPVEPAPRLPSCLKAMEANRIVLTEEAAILLFPARQGWEVPAFTGFGHHNHSPPTQVHVALLRRLADLYGADLMGMGQALLEVVVARRPATRAEALRLAHDLHAYAEEVQCGVEKQQPGEIAVGLLAHDVWGFWWD